MVFALLAFADVFEAAAARLALERATFALPLAGARAGALALLGAALFARAAWATLAEIFVSFALLVEVDLDDRRIALAERLDDFFDVFFRVDMADLLLTSSASGLGDAFHGLTARSSQPVRSSLPCRHPERGRPKRVWLASRGGEDAPSP